MEVRGQHADELARYHEARTKQLEARGFRVLRFWNSEVSRDSQGVAEKIGRVLRADA